MINATVKVDLKSLSGFKDRINRDLRSGGQVAGGSPINNAIKQWGTRYRSFIQERFLIFSRGGGNWPPLKPSTIRARMRRRKGMRKGKRGSYKGVITAAILRDTGQLYQALSPEFTGKPGAIEQAIPFGVRVGYGGPGMYTKKYGGVATIADIANFHQTGAGHLPKREIIVPPDRHTTELMAEDMQRALNKMIYGE